ncbi:MAG: chromate resistance protein, partial [Rhizobacter sp.]|nr:chromate resistance protein [Rhizobacter sp.]
LAEALAAVQRIDYFPGVSLLQAQEFLAALRRDVDVRYSPGEPQPRAARVARLEPGQYLGKRWATRARPWVDRLACAWFVRRFIDADARFVWLKEPLKLPRGALGFDFDGATFSHVGGLVSFEVMVASFGFDGDERLRRVAQVVHVLDVGGIPVPEAAGLETILGGLRDLHANDDSLLTAACSVFDALYVAHKIAAK